MIPTTVKVGPYVYEVEYTDTLSPDQWGEMSTTDLTIKLAVEQADGQTRDTLLHEVLHAIWAMMTIGDKAKEEYAVHRLATGLLMVLRDNPQLVRSLCE